MRTRAVTAITSLAAGLLVAPTFASAQATGTIAYAQGAGPGGLFTTTLSGAPQPLAADQKATNPAWSPDGSRIAYVWQSPNRPTMQIRTIAASGGAPTIVVANGENPAYSPDGRQIAYTGTGANPGLWVVPARGGRSKRVASAGNPRNSLVADVAWTPNGRLLYTTVRWTGSSPSSAIVHLHGVAAAGGRTTTIPVSPPPGMALTADSLAISRSGTTLAVTLSPRRSLTGPYSLALLPVTGGTPTAVIPNTMSGSFSPDGTQLCAVQGDYPVFSTLAIISLTGALVASPGITAANCAWQP